MKVINVSLYGGKSIFGGRETPLEASVISCDKHESCSYYNSGQCLKIRSFLSSSCKYGDRTDIKGYTSRAKKYREFKQKWESHEQYNKLKYPPKKLGLIDGEVVFPYPFVKITKSEEGKWAVKEPGFGSSIAFIPIEEFDIHLINRICGYKPRALMGGEIKSYQDETVPLFLSHLKEVLPHLYEQVIKMNEDIVKNIDYKGREVLLASLKPCVVEYRSKKYPEFNEKWHWDGELLHYKEGYVNKPRVAQMDEVISFQIKPKKDAVIKITSNDQVDEDTVFVD